MTELTSVQMELVEAQFYKTTSWVCQSCDKWFEDKDDLLEHYGFSKETFTYNNKEIPKNYFCKDTGKGNVTV